MPTPSPEEHRRLVAAATDALKLTELSAEEAVIVRLRQVQRHVHDRLKEVATARGYIEAQPLAALASRLILDELCKWDKDEVYFLLASTLAIDAVERLRNS